MEIGSGLAKVEVIAFYSRRDILVVLYRYIFKKTYQDIMMDQIFMERGKEILWWTLRFSVL